MGETIITDAATMTDARFREMRQREVDSNYAAFRGMLGGLVADHAGRYALMKGRKVAGIFDTFGDARTAGDMQYADRIYSVQEITHKAAHLGFWSIF